MAAFNLEMLLVRCSRQCGGKNQQFYILGGLLMFYYTQVDLRLALTLTFAFITFSFCSNGIFHSLFGTKLWDKGFHTSGMYVDDVSIVLV